jgi:hypothetical protein
MTKEFYLTMKMIFAEVKRSKKPCKVYYVDFKTKQLAIPPRIKGVK